MIKYITKNLYAIIVNHNYLPGGKRKGSILKHGAIFLHHEDGKKYRGGDLVSLEWNLGKLNLAWKLALHHPGHDHDISGNVQVPGVALYWSLDYVPGWRWFQDKLGLYNPTAACGGKYITRRIGAYVHDWALWVSLWENGNGWSSDDPRWWSFNVHLHPMALLFGDTKYNEGDVIHDKVVNFPVPEKSYKGRVKIQADQWKRPRWPWPRTLLRAHVSMEEPIPHPGKGENSWDCGDDALYGFMAPCRTVEEAIGKVVGLVLRSRQKYGGSHEFTPQDSSPSAAPVLAGATKQKTKSA